MDMDKNNTQLDVTVWFRDFVEANRGYFPTDHYQMLSSVAEMLNDFEIATLRVQMNTLESRNTLLHEEVLRLRAERDEVQRELNAMTKRIGDASILLADWDGYYNPETRTGNTVELANLMEDAYKILQGKSWRDFTNYGGEQP